jgi:hypothetical protein
MDERMTQRVLAELDRRGFFDQVPDVTPPPDVRRRIARDSFMGQSIALRLALDDFVAVVRPQIAAAARRMTHIIAANFGRRDGR